MPASAVGIDAFLSYNRRDTGSAETLATALRDRGVAPFLDRWNIPPGASFPVELEKALQECSAVVVLIGPEGLSGWQRTESDYAIVREQRGEDVRVIPVLLPGSDPPLGLIGLRNWIDLRAGLKQPPLLDLLASAVGGGDVPAPLAICPYRGLHPFRQEDAPFFFGRDEFVQRALQSVSSQPLTAIVGASGSGKSSAIRAGLLPALEKDDRSTWAFILMRPGREPFHSLAANVDAVFSSGGALAAERALRARELGDRLASGSLGVGEFIDTHLSTAATRPRVLLVVDQWEEIYTQCADQGVRHRFIDALLDAASRGIVHAVLAVRGDFFDDVLDHRGLADHLHDAVVNIGPMTRDELRQCAEEPARKVNLAFQEGLCKAILDDVEGGAGNLPLLEFVLTELWQQRRGDLLVHAAYERMGGLRGAIAKRAETEFAKLSAAQQELLHGVMLQLVRVAPGAADTRRRATRSEIGEAAWQVVLAMADARLLVTSRDDTSEEDAVEVAHEALISHWDRLRRWLDEDREFLLWRQRLHGALDLYREGGGDAALLRGNVLAEARHWAALRSGRLTEHERSFIAASQRHERIRLWRRAANAAVLAVVLSLLGITSFRMIRDRRDLERRRNTQILNAAADMTDPLLAALLVAELDGRREPFPGASTIAGAIARRAVPVAVLARSDAQLTTAAISSDGSAVLSGYDDGAVLLWPADGSGDARAQPALSAAVHQLAFSADGTLGLAVAAEGETLVWRLDGGGELRPWGNVAPRLVSAAFAQAGAAVVGAAMDGSVHVWPLHEGARAKSVASAIGIPTGLYLDRSGRRFAVTSGPVVQVWSDDTAQPLVLSGHDDRIVDASFDSAGNRLATASWDGTGRVWDLRTGEGRVALSAAGGAIWTVQLNAAGTRLVTAADDGTVAVTPVDEQEAMPRTWQHRGTAWAARFSADGTRVASAGADSTILVWHTADTGAEPLALRGHRGAISAVLFSADGSRLITVSRTDGSIRVWNASPHSDPVIFRATAPVFDAALEPGTGVIGIAADDGAAVWSPRFDRTSRLEGHTRGVASVTFDAQGARVLTGSWDGTARIWNAADGQPLASLEGHTQKVRARFDPDGLRIVTASEDNTARVWSGPDFQDHVALNGHTAPVREAVFSPDGSLVATAAEDHTARVFDADDGALRSVYRHAAPVRTVEFTADGRQLLTASEDGTAALWDLASDSAIVLRGHQGAVFQASFSPDGRNVVTASADGSARIWTPARGGEPIRLGGSGELRGARFSHDGTSVVTASTDGTARVFRIAHSSVEMILEGHHGAVLDAFFAPGDTTVVTVGEDRSVRVWRVAWTALHDHLKNATTACLPSAIREEVLGESPETAVRTFQQCERLHGRSTQAPR